jgi:hypothetical protein
VAPQERGGEVRLSVLGGARTRAGFALHWPIWRDAVSLTTIRALMARGDLDDGPVSDRCTIDRVLEARRISVGKFMNFTIARVMGWSERSK